MHRLIVHTCNYIVYININIINISVSPISLLVWLPLESYNVTFVLNIHYLKSVDTSLSFCTKKH